MYRPILLKSHSVTGATDQKKEAVAAKPNPSHKVVRSHRIQTVVELFGAVDRYWRARHDVTHDKEDAGQFATANGEALGGILRTLHSFK